jgi:hypothetical protein
MTTQVSGNHVDLTGNIPNSSEALSAFISRLEILKANLASVKGQAKSLGTIKAFSGIISNIQCVKDVEAWLTTAFRLVDGSGEPYHEDRAVGKFFPEDNIPTFGAFSDIYVVLAICEELEGTVTKGEILKERDLIEKAGLNHPGEPTIIYALRHTIPNFLAKGTANSRLTALKSVKTAADWDQVFSKDLSRGLKDVWEERQPDVESVIWGHIDDLLVRHGHTQAAALAREMLSKSLKFTN